jgi:hypothetical protein
MNEVSLNQEKKGRSSYNFQLIHFRVETKFKSESTLLFSNSNSILILKISRIPEAKKSLKSQLKPFNLLESIVQNPNHV